MTKRESQKKYKASIKGKITQAKWYRSKTHLEANKSDYRVLRRRVLEKLGNQCVECGISDFRVLQIDHVNGGGNRERRALYSSLLYLKNVEKDNGAVYQLLCANCNWIKKYENNEIRR